MACETNKVLLTMLNSMAGRDFEAALDRHIDWGLRVLDLKDGIYGKAVADLTNEEAQKAAAAIARRGLAVSTLSTSLFHHDVEKGPEAFNQDLDKAGRIIVLAKVLKPRLIRLLSASSSNRTDFANCADYISRQHPWLFDSYRNAAAKINTAGFGVVIENETGGSIFSNPQEVLDFFAKLNCGTRVRFIWDIQNLWQEGTFPTVEVYEHLKPVIGMVHLKGGRSETPGGPLVWRSSLADASWPVLDIIRRVAADRASPVICLNPSHGQAPPGFKENYKQDLDFIRQAIPEIE